VLMGAGLIVPAVRSGGIAIGCLAIDILPGGMLVTLGLTIFGAVAILAGVTGNVVTGLLILG
jgi:hypothetical protein